MAKQEAVCAGTVVGTYCLCKKSAKAVGEGGDRALHAPAILPGLLSCAVTWDLKV